MAVAMAAVAADVAANIALSHGKSRHRHHPSLSAKGTPAMPTLTTYKLTMKVFLSIITVFLYSLPTILCETTDQIDPLIVNDISNVPYVSMNNSVYKIVEAIHDGSFIVGASNHVLRVNLSTYTIIDSIKNGPDSENKNCRPEGPCPSRSLQDQKNNVIFISYETRGFPKIISCGSNRQGMCTIRHFNTLKASGFIGGPEDTTNYVASSKYTLSLQVPLKNNQVAYLIGHEYDGRKVEYSPPALSLRRIGTNPRPTFNYIHTDGSNLNSAIDIIPQFKTSYPIEFIHGFHDDEYMYILTNQKASLSSSSIHFEARLARICIGDLTLRSYTEIPLSCEVENNKRPSDNGINTQFYKKATAGYVTTIGSDLAQNIGIESGKFLFVALSAAHPTRHMDIEYHLGSAVCGISIKKLNQIFDNVTEMCFMGGKDPSTSDTVVELHPAFTKGPNYCTEHRVGTKKFCGESSYNPYILGIDEVHLTPLYHMKRPEKITSLLAYTEESSTIALIGTDKGYIMKTLMPPRPEELFRQYFAKPNETNNEEKIIRPDPVFTKDRTMVVFLVADRIVKFPTNSCAIYSSCSSCITTKDPLGCGWCDGKCANSKECSSTPSQFCSPVIESFTPKAGPKEGGTQINIFGDNFGTSQAGRPDGLEVSIVNGPNVKPCELSSWTNNKITCTTKGSFDLDSGYIRVKVKDYSKTVGNYDIEGKTTSNDLFQFVTPSVDAISPTYGPASGNVKMSIIGTNLEIGSNREVLVIDPTTGSRLIECKITSSNYSTILCDTTSKYGPRENGSILVKFDNKQITHDKPYIFKKDPNISYWYPKVVTISTGLNINISGSNLDSIAKPVIKFGNMSIECKSTSSNIICPLGKLPKSLENHKVLVEITNDGNKLAKTTKTQATLTVLPDPEFYAISPTEKVYLDDNVLELRGSNLNTEYPVNITLGSDGFFCEPIWFNSNRLKCKIQFGSTTPSKGDVLNVQYNVGSVGKSLGEVTFDERVSNGISPYVVIIICILIVCGFVAAFVLYVRRSRANEKELPAVMFHSNDQSSSGANEYASTSRDSDLENRPLISPLRRLDEETIALFASSNKLIAREYLSCGELVGKGHFGKVFKGTLEIPGDGSRKEVAIKTLQHFTTYDEMDSFVREACIMKDFSHENVMTLIGLVFPDDDSPLLILPFMCNGDLLQYVRDENREPRIRDLLKFSLDIAKGMEYLAQQKFVHRDLAARNCMLDENLNVCVADFGLSRDVYEKGYYRPNQRTPLPYKWMAPESIKMFTFTTKSDVWSYAVTSWELITRGFIPYAGVQNFELEDFLDSGRRLDRPDFCPEGIYNLWQRCWSHNPSLRPTFTEIVKEITDFMDAVDASAALQTRIPYDAIYRNVGSRYYNENNDNPEAEAGTSRQATNFTRNRPRMEEPVENSSL